MREKCLCHSGFALAWISLMAGESEHYSIAFRRSGREVLFYGAQKQHISIIM